MANRKVHQWTMTGDIALAKAVLGIRPETKEEWDSLTVKSILNLLSRDIEKGRE